MAWTNNAGERKSVASVVREMQGSQDAALVERPLLSSRRHKIQAKTIAHFKAPRLGQLNRRITRGQAKGEENI